MALKKNELNYIIISTMLLSAVASAQNDDPDFSKEARFHEIYKNYNEKPTDEQVWSQSVSQQKSQTYLIQNGDTLWGISETLFGDPFFWPKIWAINHKDIFNPHQIEKGFAVRFFPGSSLEAPAVQIEKVTDKTEKKVEQSTAAIEENQIQGDKAEKVEIPPPRKKPLPVASVPPSLPHTYSVMVNEPQPEFQMKRKNFFESTAEMDLKYFVTEKEKSSLGQIIEVENGYGSAAQYQYVIVKVKNPSIKTYHVIRELDDIIDLTDSIASESYKRRAKLYEIQGEISLLEKVNSKENYYRALVTKSNSLISLNGLLLEGTIQKFDLSYTQAETPAAMAAIIGGQFNSRSNIFSQDAFVYLNKGSNSGFKVGQILKAYNNTKMRNSESVEEENNKEVALIKIINVSDMFATGYVLKTSGELRAGDYVGPKSSLNSMTE